MRHRVLNEKIEHLITRVRQLECGHDVRDLYFSPVYYFGCAATIWTKRCKCGKEFETIRGEINYLKEKRVLMKAILEADSQRLKELLNNRERKAD